MRPRGIEPLSNAWKALMLTTTPRSLVIGLLKVELLLWYMYYLILGGRKHC